MRSSRPAYVSKVTVGLFIISRKMANFWSLESLRSTETFTSVLLLLFALQGFNVFANDCFTPRNITADFNSSCYQAANFSKVNLTSSAPNANTIGFPADTVCPEAWNNFMNAFAGKDPSTVNLSDYDGYYAVLPITPGANEVLFWSGTPMITDFVSTMNSKICSSFTLASSVIVNGLGIDVCWCGNASGGIEYDNPCPPMPTTSFWASFSCMLGVNAKGTVFWLAWGERPGGTFQMGNFFALYEFPALVAPRVTKLVVFDVHREGMGESCGEGSLVTLENEAKSKFSEKGYLCYNIFGDAKTTNMSEQQRLAEMIVPLIRMEQNGENILYPPLTLHHAMPTYYPPSYYIHLSPSTMLVLLTRPSSAELPIFHRMAKLGLGNAVDFVYLQTTWCGSCAYTFL